MLLKPQILHSNITLNQCSKSSITQIKQKLLRVPLKFSPIRKDSTNRLEMKQLRRTETHAARRKRPNATI